MDRKDFNELVIATIRKNPFITVNELWYVTKIDYEILLDIFEEFGDINMIRFKILNHIL